MTLMLMSCIDLLFRGLAFCMIKEYVEGWIGIICCSIGDEALWRNAGYQKAVL